MPKRLMSIELLYELEVFSTGNSINKGIDFWGGFWRPVGSALRKSLILYVDKKLKAENKREAWRAKN